MKIDLPKNLRSDAGGVSRTKVMALIVFNGMQVIILNNVSLFYIIVPLIILINFCVLIEIENDNLFKNFEKMMNFMSKKHKFRVNNKSRVSRIYRKKKIKFRNKKRSFIFLKLRLNIKNTLKRRIFSKMTYYNEKTIKDKMYVDKNTGYVADEKYYYALLNPIQAHQNLDTVQQTAFIEEIANFLQKNNRTITLFSYKENMEIKDHKINNITTPVEKSYLEMQNNFIETIENELEIDRYVIRFEKGEEANVTSPLFMLLKPTEEDLDLISSLVYSDYDYYDEVVYKPTIINYYNKRNLEVVESYLTISSFGAYNDYFFLESIINALPEQKIIKTFNEDSNTWKKNFSKKINAVEEKIESITSRKKNTYSEVSELTTESVFYQTIADNLISGDDKLISLEVIIRIRKESKESVDNRIKEIKEEFKNVKFSQKLFDTKRISDNLTGESDLEDEKNLVDAITYPVSTFADGGLFSFVEVNDENGFIKNVGTNSFIKIDKTKKDKLRLTTHTGIFGDAGAGKSTTIKTHILELLHQGAIVYNVDLQGDYFKLTKALGGSVIKYDKNNMVNPLDIPFEVLTKKEYETESEFNARQREQNKTDITGQLTFLKGFLKMLFPDLSTKEELLFEKLLGDFYSHLKLDHNSVSEDFPTFSNFKQYLIDNVDNADYTDLLKHINSDDLDTIFLYLDSLTTGGLSAILNGKTTVEINNRFINFDISTYTSNVQYINILMYNIFHYLSVQMRQSINGKYIKKHFVFDEAHKLFVNDDCTLFVESTLREGRKFEAGVDIADQKYSSIPESIRTHLSYVYLFKETYKEEREKQAKLLNVDSSRLSVLQHCDKGEGLLYLSSTGVCNDVKVNITPYMAEVFNGGS